MIVIAFIAGCLIGVLLAVYCNHNRPVGKLKVVWDSEEQQPYMFMEVASQDLSKITGAKYVTLEVNEDVTMLSHK